MVFDALDGFAARIFNAASMHGLQMDSLSDMVTFGVAPAVIVAVMAHCLRTEMKPSMYFVIWLFCGIYIGCAALRLASYNVHAMLEKKSGEKFSGLPTPGAAAAVCSLVILYSSRKGEFNQIVRVLPVYSAILGLLMVSNIPYIHAGRWILSLRRNKKRLFVLFVASLCCFYEPVLSIAAIINAYIISGPVIVVFAKLKNAPAGKG
jgi:CDP-diacylglycerol--serine O-phosphatidyltransferase